MSPVSPLPAIACLLIAIATAFGLGRKFGVTSSYGRFASIDGLRGYLGIFVFLHHACIWYFYLHTGQWQVPPSNLYTHFGQSGVVFFFMITGFLFSSKLIDGRTKAVDWDKLFISRFLRLVPLYLFTIFLFILIVSYLSHGTLNQPLANLIHQLSYWLCFTFLGNPNLNGISNTFIILAGVTWSLPYEWFFYFSLPILALVIGAKPSIPYIIFSVAIVECLLRLWHPEQHHLLAFCGGIFAAFVIRSNSFCQFAVKRVSSFIAIACMAIVINLYPSAYGNMPLFLLSCTFAIFAGGNSMFGLLTSSAARTLGEITYSIYMLHGIVLFIVFNFIIGIPQAQSLSPIGYWLLVMSILPIIIVLCFLTFRSIERPAMQSTIGLTNWCRSRWIKLF
jgi:peptidoglycan/LPS O-acetylase OafA/YrhL